MAGMMRRGEASMWNPFRELDEMSSRLTHWLQKEPFAGTEMADWAPRANVVEKDDGYEIQAELPGVKREDVKVTAENGVLTLSGERKCETKTEGEGASKVHRMECSYGSFTRAWTLPADADPDKIEAKFENGMLNVTIARRPAPPAPTARQIPIG